MGQSSRVEESFGATPAQHSADYGSYVTESTLNSRVLISSYQQRFGLEIPYVPGEHENRSFHRRCPLE